MLVPSSEKFGFSISKSFGTLTLCCANELSRNSEQEKTFINRGRAECAKNEQAAKGNKAVLIMCEPSDNEAN